ncbi:phosphoglycerate dehydrogenase [Candidatus Soleaferrea massiliensis]|uniref:phosphoglycerate dehydrogenase n=1 Tax=Candidatus Soleaferrea massiliensis TaxID=1470354 RepID=UPI00058E38A6|nr:phosphoglycerate dehydrogenase [Candidatus Soleaferrea massiliensis]
MFEIKLLNKISPAGLEKLDNSKYRCADDSENPDAIMVRSAAMHEMEFGKKLKAIARAGAGVNNIPIERCSENGIVVFNTPGANANAVKELVLAALLLSSRKIVQGINWTKTLKGKGDEVGKLVEKGKSQFAGPEIAGKKLGVIGLGAIGILVANIGCRLGMEVYGYDPYISVEGAWGLSRSVKHAKSLKEIFENCDYISVHVPLTPETKGLVNSESIKLMKKDVRILNFARGELAVAEDIKAGIEEGRIACYATDFPTEELIDVEGVLTIPHLGASTPESEDNCAKMAAVELVGYLEYGNIKNSVNLPDAEMPYTGDTRVTIIHKNIPNMLTQISSAFSGANANIDNLINKSKKDYAYTMIDLSGEVEAQVIENLKKIEGVIRVRVI